MKKRTLGPNGPEVSAIGLGCMGMSAFYGATDEGEAMRTIHRALELGCNFLDTSDMYGPHTNERLVGSAIAGRRDEVVLATKFGIKLEPGEDDELTKRSIDGSPDVCARGLRGLAERLGIDHIDLYYQHRVDPNTPIEETVGAMAELVQQGKVRHIGLSEASAADDPPRARGAPDHGGADGVLAVDARRRGGDPADAQRARHRARRLLAARARLPVRALHLAGGARRGRLPPLRPALHGREPRAEPDARRARARARGRARASRRASSRSRGCCTAASTSCRSPAPSAWPTWRRTSPRPMCS